MQKDPTADRAGGEHILACLSSSPSNARIMHTASRMAAAFRGSFTALYVQTPGSRNMSAADRERLHANMRLAEHLGADISVVDGEDVVEQIAEFVRVSGITILVLGRSSTRRRHIWGPQPLSERIRALTPDIDVHIIPDPASDSDYREGRVHVPGQILSGVSDLLIMGLILSLVTFLGSLFLRLHFAEYNITPVYILGVLLISVFTRGYACSVISAVLSVVLFNFFLTEPRYTFHAYGSGYPVTFAILLATAVITGTLAARLKDQIKLSAQAAYRAKILYDTDQQLGKARGEEEILRVTADQLRKLLGCGIAVYPEQGGRLGDCVYYPLQEDGPREGPGDREREVAAWSLRSRKRAGASTEVFPDADFLFLPVVIRGKAFGVIAVDRRDVPVDVPFDSFLLSIVGECALAIENDRNHKEKEEAAVRARNEQLRADLLRAISHDLRTPLTSISGNADNLLHGGDLMDAQTRMQVYTDIYEDSQWLISLVENLLAVSRIREGRMELRLSPQPVEEVMEEALQHVRGRGHSLRIEGRDPRGDGETLLLARMDAKLIIQVIINLAENAVKYTPAGTEILVGARRRGSEILLHVSDTGPGIPDEAKPYVFDMFYTGRHSVADSRRSLGLGLYLCRSIVRAHGGELTLRDNVPHGCIFEFSLPAEEVILHE